MLIDHNMKYFMLFSFFLDFDFEDLNFLSYIVFLIGDRGTKRAW